MLFIYYYIYIHRYYHTSTILCHIDLERLTVVDFIAYASIETVTSLLGLLIYYGTSLTTEQPDDPANLTLHMQISAEQVRLYGY